MKKHFLVKITMQEKSGDERVRVIKVLTTAISYTDAEKTGIELYEKLFKEEYRNPDVSAISPDKFNLHHDMLDPSSVELEAEFANVYRVKLAVVFKGESTKRIGKIMLCRANSIEEAIKGAQDSARQFYDAESVEAVGVTETDIYPLSPIFEPADSGVEDN